MDGICDLPGLSSLCQAAGSTAGAMVAAPFEFVAQAIGGAAAWLLRSVWWFIDQTTLVDLTNPTFVRAYDLVFGIALVLCLALALVQLVGAMVHHEPRALATAAVGLGRGVLGSFLVVAVAGSLLAITDELSVGIVQAAGTTMDEMGTRLATLATGFTTIQIAAPGAGAILEIFLGALAITGALLVLGSLLVRKALLLVTIVLGPFALAGQGWQATRSWLARWATFSIALIVSKLVVVIVLLVGTAQLDTPLDPEVASIADPMAGVVLLLIAAFAPYMVYKLISFAGVDVYHAMSTEAEAKQAVDRPLPVMQPPRIDPSGIVGGARGAGGRSGSAPEASAASGPALPGGAAGASAGGAGASGGAGGATAAGGGAGGSAAGWAAGGAAGGAAVAAGPVGAVIVAAEIAGAAAGAGPRLGGAVGGAADQQVSGAEESIAPSSVVAPPPLPSAGTTARAPGTPGAQPTSPRPGTVEDPSAGSEP